MAELVDYSKSELRANASSPPIQMHTLETFPDTHGSTALQLGKLELDYSLIPTSANRAAHPGMI